MESLSSKCETFYIGSLLSRFCFLLSCSSKIFHTCSIATLIIVMIIFTKRFGGGMVMAKIDNCISAARIDGRINRRCTFGGFSSIVNAALKKNFAGVCSFTS